MKATAVGTVLLVLSPWYPAWAEQSATEIFKATGVQGGLVVQLGCGDGKLTAALRADDSFLVQGLDVDPANVEKTRAHAQSLGLSGQVSAEVFDGQHLPYVDNLVNLLVVTSRSSVDREEMLRVLHPGGVAVTLDAHHSILETLCKPWPAEMDEWTHYLHGPDNNAVAQDSLVGPARYFQWIAEPRFSRSHDHLASVSTVVSSGGRLFYIVDTGSIAFAGASPRWRLVARDAFNGIRLWEREISRWEYHLRDFRSGPADIARRLVAVGDRVYATLGYGEPVVALDAATGKTVRTYAGTGETREILWDNNALFLVLGSPHKSWRAETAKEIVSQKDYHPPFERYTPPAHERRLMAVNADTGQVLWRVSEPYTRDIMPSTLATSAGQVFFQNADAVLCLDATTGRLQWQTPRPVHRQRLGWSTPTLVVHDGVVFSADRRAAQTDGEILWMPSGGYHQYLRGEDVKGELIAFEARTGERLWSGSAYEGFNAPVDVMIADGLLWAGRYAWGRDPGITEARDPRTGTVRRRRPSELESLPRLGHARCHRAKATSRYLILGRRGVEFVDLATGKMIANFFVRGICQYGVMPANGLLYIPPHSCACSSGDMLKCGFVALASAEARPQRQPVQAEEALQRGPAYHGAKAGPATSVSQESLDWPTYRRAPGRGGSTSAIATDNLQVAWQTQLGGRLTSPVIAQDVLLVAEADAHRVDALQASTGRRLWSYSAGGRIDSPPTIDAGRILFGSADGWVYCLRLTDGELIWRFRAAPCEQRIVVNGQLESPWPVPGNVLVLNGSAYFAAGRNSYLDGGMFLYKLQAATGQKLQMVRLEIEKEKRDAGIARGGSLPDILSTDGNSVFLRSARFDLDLNRQKDDVPHLWSSMGFRDDSWWHRTYWQIGTSMASGWGGWAKAGQRVPAGRLLVTDGTRVFGYGRNQYDIPGAHVGVDANGVWGPIGQQMGRWTFYQLFAKTLKPFDRQASRQSRRKPQEPAANKSDWTCRLPILGQAMVLAGKTLFVAGPPNPVAEIPHEPAAVDPLAEVLESSTGGRLLAVSTTTGKTLAEYELQSSPVFDGMAAAYGRLYLSTKNGAIVCMDRAR